MHVVNLDISSIVPYPDNTKKHDQEQIDNVARSIERYGFVQPIVVDGNGVIIIGHCRHAAAKQLGLTEVPCVVMDNLTPDQCDALRIVDNKTNESDWDLGLLESELEKLTLELEDFTFDFDFGDDEKDDQDDEPEEEPDTGIGDGCVECPRCGYRFPPPKED